MITHYNRKIGPKLTNARKAFSYRVLGNRPEKLLFEHIPKCGGTTVKEFLKSQYPANQIFEIKGLDVDRSLDEFRGMQEKQRHSLNLVLGHGAHKLRHLYHPDAFRLTILRDPVDRIVSHYFFAVASPRHYLHKVVNERSMTLADYATSNLSPELRNNYVRRFSGIPAEEAEKTPEASIEKVLAVLNEEYAVVGFTDAIASAMTDISRVCRFHRAYRPKRENVTASRPAAIDEETLRIIKEVNFLDVELYRRLKNRCQPDSGTGP